MEEIYFITGNANKLREAKKILGVELKSKNIDLPEIQALMVKEIIKDKAKRAYEILQKPLIVEDVGLYIKAWNDFPGAFIKWVIKTKGCEGIIKSMGNYKNREAFVEAGICYYDGKEFKTFFGKVKGTIPFEKRGESRFGLDPSFIPDGYEKSFAEMTSEEKNKISHRGIAFKKLKEFFDSRE
jgi:XTP/dITP diphosphohydrolase